MVAVSYHDTVNVLQAHAPAIARAAGPFARPEWFTLLAGPGGRIPLVALAQEGAAFVALPLMRDGRALVPLANWYSFTWAPLASPDADRAALLGAVARDLKRRAGRVVLAPLADEDGAARDLKMAFRAAGWETFLEFCDNNHVLPVGQRSYAAYLAARPGPLRTTLKRKSKHVAVDVLTGFDPDAWRSYEEIYRRSWKPEEGAPALLRAFAEQEGAAGRLRLGVARSGDKPVAAQFWTVDDGTAYIHKLAHLEEARPLSAGTVLTAALMERAIDRDGVTLVDFGTGDDPYKRDWMEAVRPRFRLTCLNPRDPGAWPALAKARVRQLASRRAAD